MSESIVVLRDVRKDYHVKGRTVPVKALRGVTMDIPDGSMVAIEWFSIAVSGLGTEAVSCIILPRFRNSTQTPQAGQAEVPARATAKSRSLAGSTNEQARPLGGLNRHGQVKGLKSWSLAWTTVWGNYMVIV